MSFPWTLSSADFDKMGVWVYAAQAATDQRDDWGTLIGECAFRIAMTLR